MMVKINLRDFYPFYQRDCFIEVSDEQAELLICLERVEAARQRQVFRHKAYFSLNRMDGIERDILFVSLSPDEIYERKVTREQLHAAISSLSDKQAKRIYAHFFLDMSKSKIAKAEGVSKESVGESIQRGLWKIELFLKESCN
jgi:RNA polymerase sigma-70 factor (ECF subfamily)